jgi:hypothetical protein
MIDLMIDIETLGVVPEANISTIAAQLFDPFADGYTEDDHFYSRISPESQPNRIVSESTLDWWAKQPKEAKEEAFGDADRIDLKVALEKLAKLIWRSDHVWSQGPTFDMNILENAYREYDINFPWDFWNIRDSRTVFSLYPDLVMPKVEHHALADCRRQILLLQKTLKHLKVERIK